MYMYKIWTLMDVEKASRFMKYCLMFGSEHVYEKISHVYPQIGWYLREGCQFSWFKSDIIRNIQTDLYSNITQAF